MVNGRHQEVPEERLGVVPEVIAVTRDNLVWHFLFTFHFLHTHSELCIEQNIQVDSLSSIMHLSF